MLGPSAGLEALGASAGASAGLGADADPLGASELEVLAPSATAKGATATAARRITTSARARAMEGVLVFRLARFVNSYAACVSVLMVTAFCVLGVAILVALYARLVAIFGRSVGIALRWHVLGSARRGACPMRTRPFLGTGRWMRHVAWRASFLSTITGKFTRHFESPYRRVKKK